MAIKQISLDQLQITSPCPLPPDAVPTAGFCTRCDKPVHDLSQMTRARAERFLSAAPPTSQLCVRYNLTPAGGVQSLDYAPPKPLRFRTRLCLPVAILAATGAAIAHALLGTPKPPPSRNIAVGGISLPPTTLVQTQPPVAIPPPSP